jgi:hypothetical protein
MISGLETVTHVDLMFGGEQQSGFVDGHIRARRNFLAIEDDYETGYAGDSRDREAALIDP